MTEFLYRHRQKILLVTLLVVLLVTLTSCRWWNSSSRWAAIPYTTYGQEWKDLWDEGFWYVLWGWPVNLLSWPVAWLCSNIGKALGNSFFWGIFFTTLIVRTIAWPIYSRQNGMSVKMQMMQPELSKIQRKYANRKDQQSQQAMQMETAKLYKKYKISPLGCIGPMFLQFPIFMAMYEVVRRINTTTTTSIDGATGVTYAGSFALANTKLFGFFEINTSFFDASEIKDKIFAVVVALAFGALQILQQKLSQRPPKYQKQHNGVKTQQQEQQQKQMKTMMLVMNIMFVFMSLSSTSLAIYWLIGGIYQLFQSMVGRKMNERAYYKMKEKNNI